LQIFSNLVANDYKSHVVVNGVVTFWLISTSGASMVWLAKGIDSPLLAVLCVFYKLKVSITLQKTHVAFILKHTIIASECFPRLITL
jgi:hypothetical protein